MNEDIINLNEENIRNLKKELKYKQLVRNSIKTGIFANLKKLSPDRGCKKAIGHLDENSKIPKYDDCGINHNSNL